MSGTGWTGEHDSPTGPDGSVSTSVSGTGVAGPRFARGPSGLSGPGEAGEVGVQGLDPSGEGFPEIPPPDGRDLLVGPELPATGGVAGEECGVLGPLVGREHESRVADEPQRPIGFLPALLPQLPSCCQSRGFVCLSTPTRQFPALTETIEDHQDTTGVPQGDKCRRQRCVIRWRRLRPTDEGDKGIAATVDHERRFSEIGHVVIIPVPRPGNAQADPTRTRPRTSTRSDLVINGPGGP